MANIAVQKPSLTAAAPTSTAANGGGDSLTGVVDGTPLFIRFTVGANATTVTIDDPNSQGPQNANQFDPDVIVASFISASRVVKIPDPTRFKNPTTGFVNLTYSQVTGLLVEAYQ